MKTSVPCYLRYGILAAMLAWQPVHASSPSIVMEHDWTWECGDFIFGFEQSAPILVEPNRFFPKGVVVMPRTTVVYFGPWSKQIEGVSATTILLAAVMMLCMIAAFAARFVRRKETFTLPTPEHGNSAPRP